MLVSKKWFFWAFVAFVASSAVVLPDAVVAAAEEGEQGDGEDGEGEVNNIGDAGDEPESDIPPEEMEKIMEMLKQQDAANGGPGGMGGMGDMADMMGGMGGMGDMADMMGGMGGMGDMADMMGGMGGMGDMMGGMGGMDMAQMMGGMGGMGMGGPPKFEGVKSDVKFILCDSCQAMVKEARQSVRALRESLPNTKIAEDRIDDMLEKLCDAKEEVGSWITFYDMVESEDNERIDLVKQDKPGQCKEECKTVELACAKIYEEIGSDLVEMLYLDKKTDEEISNVLCKKNIKRFKGACGKKYPKIPQDREAGGDNFEAKTEEQLEMDKINRKIRNTPGVGSFNMRDEL